MPAISTKICAVSPTLQLLRCHFHHYFTYLMAEAELWAIRYRYCLLTPSMVQTSTRDHRPPRHEDTNLFTATRQSSCSEKQETSPQEKVAPRSAITILLSPRVTRIRGTTKTMPQARWLRELSRAIRAPESRLLEAQTRANQHRM